MELNLPNINVVIHVDGPVEDSEITGVKLTLPNGSASELSGSLFRKYFVEYLGLPSLLELQSRLKVRAATRRRRCFEFDTVGSLWNDLVYPMRSVLPRHDSLGYYRRSSRPPLTAGTVVRLRDVHLSPFVNRNPGYQYAYPTAGRSLQNEEVLVGLPLIIVEDFAARNAGLGGSPK